MKLNINSIQLANSIKPFNQLITNTSKIISSMKLDRLIKDFETSIGRKLVHDAVIMEGFLDIVNGDTVIHGKNSVVDQGLCGIINWISGNSINLCGSLDWNGSPPNYNTFMAIGTDINQKTSNGTISLAQPVQAPTNITKPNSQIGAMSNPGTGQWQIQWTATWNAGTIPINTTLGEVGLYLYLVGSQQGFQAGTNAGTTLFSRMAVADGKFTSFLINNTVPLSIAWNFRLTYST